MGVLFIMSDGTVSSRDKKLPDNWVPEGYEHNKQKKTTTRRIKHTVNGVEIVGYVYESSDSEDKQDI
jgi:hypothetical protein